MARGQSRTGKSRRPNDDTITTGMMVMTIVLDACLFGTFEIGLTGEVHNFRPAQRKPPLLLEVLHGPSGFLNHIKEYQPTHKPGDIRTPYTK